MFSHCYLAVLESPAWPLRSQSPWTLTSPAFCECTSIIKGWLLHDVSLGRSQSDKVRQFGDRLCKCRLMRFSMAMTALAKLGRRPQGSEAQHILAELDRRLEGADARVGSMLLAAEPRSHCSGTFTFVSCVAELFPSLQ